MPATLTDRRTPPEEMRDQLRLLRLLTSEDGWTLTAVEAERELGLRRPPPAPRPDARG